MIHPTDQTILLCSLISYCLGLGLVCYGLVQFALVWFL